MVGAWGAVILRRQGEVYRVAEANLAGPRLTLSSMRHVHIIPQLQDIEYNAPGGSRSRIVGTADIIVG